MSCMHDSILRRDDVIVLNQSHARFMSNFPVPLFNCAKIKYFISPIIQINSINVRFIEQTSNKKNRRCFVEQCLTYFCCCLCFQYDREMHIIDLQLMTYNV